MTQTLHRAQTLHQTLHDQTVVDLRFAGFAGFAGFETDPTHTRDRVCAYARSCARGEITPPNPTNPQTPRSDTAQTRKSKPRKISRAAP